MSPLVVTLVLAAAVMHASWNALIKRSGDRLIAQALIIGAGALMSLFALPFVPPPDRAAWPLIALSVAVHTGYHAFLLLAYRHGDFSRVYPLARGTAPLGVALLAMAFAGEGLDLWEIAGVALVSGGIGSLIFSEGNPLRGDGRALFYALVTGGFISAYTLIDGLGVRRTGSALSYIVWLFLFEGQVLLLFALATRRARFPALLRREGGRLMLGGIVATVGYGIVIWAMSLGSLARVVSLRETSVIIAALIGTRLFGERAGRRRLAAAALVAAGNVLLHIF